MEKTTVKRRMTDERRMTVERVVVEGTTVGRKMLAGRARRDRDACAVRLKTPVLVSTINRRSSAFCLHDEEY